MKKNNIVIAAVVVILLLLLGAGGYLMLNKNTASSPKTTATTNTKQTEKQPTTKSLIDLVRMGQNLRCSFKAEVTNGSTEGTVYVSGQNIRADFNITTSGKIMKTSMIKNGDTNYLWGDNLPSGIKMTLSLDQISQNEQTSRYFNANQKTDYNCTPWNVDSSLFTVPTNIKFTDMTSLLAPKTTGAAVQTQTKTGAFDPCSQITNETAKAACENALKQSGQ